MGSKSGPLYVVLVSVGARVERLVQQVEHAAATTETADELLEAVADSVRRAIPYDAAAWFGVDPVTMLAAAPSRVEHLDAAMCDTFWHLEFHEQDTALFADLARGEGSAAALRLSLDDRVGRSTRYRDFMQPQGYHDDLRAVFRVGTSTWGVSDLYREGGHASFDEDDVAVMQGISATVARALRAHVRELNPSLVPVSAPGLIVIDRDGHVSSANAEAMSWLQSLWPGRAMSSGVEVSSLRIADFGDDIEIPTVLFALVARARAVAEGRERAPSRLRLRDRRGRWLVLHASALTGPGSPDDGAVAVVIEAARSAEIAPIIIEAYSLTPREREVLGALARGGTTAEIASELYLSPHTVRDHVKTVYEKFGVSSRGELVARLFGEHYADPLHATMVHEH
jgi:DNA-binding CsgD family transcriptional regulator